MLRKYVKDVIVRLMSLEHRINYPRQLARKTRFEVVSSTSLKMWPRRHQRKVRSLSLPANGPMGDEFAALPQTLSR